MTIIKDFSIMIIYGSYFSSTLYYVNSSNRLSGNDSDFTYYFKIPPESKDDKVCVLQMSIPKSYILFNQMKHFN